MNVRSGLKLRGVFVAGAIAAVGLMGCSSGMQTGGGEQSRPESQPVSEAIHQMALQHFIDGSIYEVKGEYAQAILEFQDALRFEKNPAVYYALAKDYAVLGKYPLAIEAGKEAVRLSPDNLEFRKVLAEAHVAAFEVDGAITQYQEIIRRDSDNIDSWYALARLYQAHRPLQALDVYERILARFGPDWNVLLQMAELQNKLGHFDKAADALKQMLDIDPSNQELQRTLAQTYTRGGNYDAALKVYDALREIDPANLDYISESAGVLLLKKEYARAAKDFESILSRDSVSIDTKLHIGELYFGQLEKDSTIAPVAKGIFERIRKAHPDDWRPYWFLGAIGSIIHDDSLSVRNFRKVTELASWNPDAWVYLSNVFLEKNDFAEVVRVLESALKVLPDDFRVNFVLGVAYNRIGRNLDAVRVLEHSRQLKPKEVDAIAQLALVYDGLKKFDESDNLYEEALKIDSSRDIILNNYAYSLAERGLQLERAMAMAKAALQKSPDNASYLDTMGWIYFRLGKYREAETYVKKAIDKGEANAVVYEHLGDIYFMLNQKQAALEQWNMALKLDKDNGALRDKIARGSL
jgi:tetratricopeptide (TPR) repeat protein